MRSIVALGVVSLAIAAGMVACGDDSSDDGPGLGGSGGTGAGAGGGGAGGAAAGTGGAAAGTGGAAAGTGGAGGSGGAAPTIPTANCTGCVQLTVPYGGTLPTDATNFQAGYEFTAPATAAPFDLSDVSTITWRVQALTTGATFYVQAYLQDGPPEDANYAFGAYGGNVALAAAAFAPNAWVDVSLDVGALAGGAGDAGTPEPATDAGDAGVALTAFDKSYVRSIGLQVGAMGTTTGTGFVSVEVDSVTVVGTSNFTSKTFNANVEGLTLNTFQAPAASVPPAFR